MLQNARVTDFTVSELLRENQKIPRPPPPPPPPPSRLGLMYLGTNYKQIKNQIIKKNSNLKQRGQSE